MRIGYVQFSPVLSDLETTIARLEVLLPQAVDADLVVLPELCNSGYNFASGEEACETAEAIGKSIFLSFLADYCREADLNIVTGFNERRGERLYNSAVLLGKQGVIGVYRKMHLFLREKDFFRPGDAGLPVFRCGSAKIGMLVCFDWQFPEVWRILALKGADIVCHPSNLVLPGLAQRAVPVHALVNRIFVVTANRIGTEGDLTFTGRSIITDPRGNILCEAPADEPSVGIVEINHLAARDKSVTARNHLFTDRRPEEYGLLVRNDE
jgi:predicted amidohydrolase